MYTAILLDAFFVFHMRCQALQKTIKSVAYIGEKVRWEESVVVFDRDITNLVGDCLVAAAFLRVVCYWVNIQY